MPSAWTYEFQVDHWATRLDTQSFFQDALISQLWRSAGTPQTWIEVIYPGAFGPQTVRMLVDGRIENNTPQEPEEGKQVQYRTTFTLKLEGYAVDLKYEFYPALWTLVIGSGSDPLTPDELRVLERADLRVDDRNPVIDSRTGIPSNETCADELRSLGEPSLQIISFGTNTPGQIDPG